MDTKSFGQKRGFALLAGGGMGSEIWNRVTGLLKHPAIAVEDRYPLSKFSDINKVTFNDCVSHAATVISDSEFTDIILVAHSGSGILAQHVAEALRDRIQGIVYISANIPPQGRCALDVLPFYIKIINILSIAMMSKGMKQSNKKTEKVIRRYFCNDSDEETISYFMKYPIKDEPKAVAYTKVYRPELPDIPKLFIRLSKDGCASLEFQDRMIANLGKPEVQTIASDHMVMLSHPKELAKVLNDFAQTNIA